MPSTERLLKAIRHEPRSNEYLAIYLNEYAEYAQETRVFGHFDMVAFRQPAGQFPDPPMDIWSLQIPMAGMAPYRMDFGGKPFRGASIGGQIFLTPPMTRCDFELGGDHEVLGIAVPASLTSAMLADVEPGFPGHFRGLHESAWRDNGVRDLALTIWRASKGDAQAPDIDPDEALMRLTMRLLHLSGQPLSKRRCNDRLAPHVARRLMEFIEANIDDDLSVFRLATVACLSPYHFARAFRHDFGDTPHAYVQRRRLARACDLIRHGRFGLAEIALAVGYSSQSRMNEVFARELGTTPGSYRRQMRL